MKKIILCLAMVAISFVAFAEDRFAYVSNVEQRPDKAIVTVSAKSTAFNYYPDGFMVGVRPANHLFDFFLLTNKSMKHVRLTKENPSAVVIFYCNDEVTGKKACSRYDFVVESKR